MAAILVGTYDASTWVTGDYSTYPQLPAGVPFYQVGMGWIVTVAGVVDGQPVQPDDILFALPKPRLYGDFTYGAKKYGSKPVNQDDGTDWLVDEIRFVAWDGNALPPDQVPFPNAGCPFTPAHGFGGEWAPGWRIIVDAFYDDSPTTRRYGDFTYGDAVYGSIDPFADASWIDITQPSFHVEIGDGMAEGGPRVSVSEVVVNFVDPVGRWFDIATPFTWYQPQPGTAIRVGLMDPQYRYHPLITAEIERIEDVHDGEGVREVSVRGFGRIMDLVVDLPQVQRPRELATARIDWYRNAAGWRWDTDPLAYPATGNSTLLADADPHDVQAREQIDRACSSVGWYLDSTRQGRMRVRQWPIQPAGDVLVVTDCYGSPGTVVSHSIVLANDESQLLNYVITTNTEDPATDPPGPVQTVISEVSPSSARFGKRGRAFGFPMTGLAWTDPVATKRWADRAAARYAYITRQCESFDIDTAVDQQWLPTLVDLDTGRSLRVWRTGLAELKLAGVVTGWRWRLDPGRWQGTVFVSTITPSL